MSQGELLSNLHEWKMDVLKAINHNRIEVLDSLFVGITNTSIIISALITIAMFIYARRRNAARPKKASIQVMFTLVSVIDKAINMRQLFFSFRTYGRCIRGILRADANSANEQ
jgi:hypothetical protein